MSKFKIICRVFIVIIVIVVGVFTGLGAGQAIQIWSNYNYDATEKEQIQFAQSGLVPLSDTMDADARDYIPSYVWTREKDSFYYLSLLTLPDSILGHMEANLYAMADSLHIADMLDSLTNVVQMGNYHQEDLDGITRITGLIPIGPYFLSVIKTVEWGYSEKELLVNAITNEHRMVRLPKTETTWLVYLGRYKEKGSNWQLVYSTSKNQQVFVPGSWVDYLQERTLAWTTKKAIQQIQEENDYKKERVNLYYGGYEYARKKHWNLLGRQSMVPVPNAVQQTAPRPYLDKKTYSVGNGKSATIYVDSQGVWIDSIDAVK